MFSPFCPTSSNRKHCCRQSYFGSLYKRQCLNEIVWTCPSQKPSWPCHALSETWVLDHHVPFGSEQLLPFAALSPSEAVLFSSVGQLHLTALLNLWTYPVLPFLWAVISTLEATSVSQNQRFRGLGGLFHGNIVGTALGFKNLLPRGVTPKKSSCLKCREHTSVDFVTPNKGPSSRLIFTSHCFFRSSAFGKLWKCHTKQGSFISPNIYQPLLLQIFSLRKAVER